jgi:hypothetical protein
MRSREGKTFQSVGTPHGDHHDLWIDPEDGNRMIVADDGGAQITFDGGNNWSPYNNQPTAQIYRVTTDNSFPYRILGAQQDNSTIRIKSRTAGVAITEQDWQPTAGAESGYVVADPQDPEVVYGGNYGGYLSRLDHRTGENRAINAWPENPMGSGADVLKYRFQWNPGFFTTQSKIIHSRQCFFATENDGASWRQSLLISLQMTRANKRQAGAYYKDNAVEYYCTILPQPELVEKDLLDRHDDGIISATKMAVKTGECYAQRCA